MPEALEREATPEQYRWIGDRAMGQPYMARVDHGDGVPLFPVDVAAWQVKRVAEVMTLLRESARASFPLRGYPRALVQAHEHARLGGLETEMLEQLPREEVANHDPAAAQQARRLKLLSQQIVAELDYG